MACRPIPLSRSLSPCLSRRSLCPSSQPSPLVGKRSQQQLLSQPSACPLPPHSPAPPLSPPHDERRSTAGRQRVAAEAAGTVAGAVTVAAARVSWSAVCSGRDAPFHHHHLDVRDRAVSQGFHQWTAKGRERKRRRKRRQPPADRPQIGAQPARPSVCLTVVCPLFVCVSSFSRSRSAV